jgi:thioester reductase-like protein
MSYDFLTGGTGLLGPYLLRDSLRAGRRLAVLCRSNRDGSASARIDASLRHWETGEVLPRPVVFDGDLTKPNLGLDTEALRWISRHCKSVIHNAASVTFDASDPAAEPWASNIGGTNQVLELCQKTGIRDMHFVSTAYVCGLRDGIVRESERDVGQSMGNDYERSKSKAEQLLLDSKLLDRVTIYRPSIIVGDSRTAYTTAYHGFYAILKLCHTMVTRGVNVPADYRSLVEGVGLKGTEKKNLVPVDWVSAVITRILNTPEFHGKTYHLTAPQPIVLDVMARAIYRTVMEAIGGKTAAIWRVNMSWFTNFFHSELKAYQTYWRDDPIFDATNRLAVAADLECPVLDEEVLVALANFAIGKGFGKPRTKLQPPTVDLSSHLKLDQLEKIRPPDKGSILGLDITGSGGGQWTLFSSPARLDRGLDPDCTEILTLPAPAFLARLKS